MRGTDPAGGTTTTRTPPVPAATVRAVNRLAARWAAALPPAPGNTVFSAAGVWPLLAFLADGARGRARDELAEALGVRADEAAGAGRGLLAALRAIRGSEAALGVWTRRELELRPEWRAGIPEGSLGRFGADPEADARGFDAWAARHTNGLIGGMPVEVLPDTLLLLAVAQGLRTRWIRPFKEVPLVTGAGPWAGRELAGLFRRTALLDRVGVAETGAGPLTVLKVLGTDGVDVHLLAGAEGAGRGAVLAAGVEVLSGARRVVPGGLLPPGEPGPALRVESVRSTDREPQLDVETVAFDVRGTHGLLALPGVFGLSAAADPAGRPLAGIGGDAPLAVQGARHDAVARFHAQGFEAASLTMLAAGGGPPREPYRVRRVTFGPDRPFGFLAVHRTSRLMLSAGWVEEPEEYAGPDGDTGWE